MMRKTNMAYRIIYPPLFLLLFLLIARCEDSNPTTEEGNAIKKFVFEATLNGELGADITATISDTTITAVVPAGTNITALVPTITIPQDYTLSPGNKQPQDFTRPVQYTTTAPDKTTRRYSANVVLAKYNQADIVTLHATTADRPMKGIVGDEVILLAGVFDEQVVEATITEIQLSPNAIADKEIGDVLVFENNTSTITVTAEDGITAKQYILVTLDTAVQILSFSLEKKNNPSAYTSLHDSDTIVEGIIDYQTKYIYIPITPYIYALDRTSLIATFEVSAGLMARVGTQKQVSGSTANDFTNSVIYEVTAADGSKSDQYTVTFTETNEASIPDDRFRNYLKNQLKDAFNEDGKMDVRHAAVKELESIDVGNKSIGSLKGIEFFMALEKLYCQDNKLVSLNLEKNKNLKIINCSRNQLTFLGVSKNSVLTELWCYSNQLDSLNIHNNNVLTTLSCFGNKLVSLDVNSRMTMKLLSCRDNQLTHLGVSYVKGTKQLIINAGEKKTDGETLDNPIVTLNVNEAIKDYTEIKKAKTNRDNKITIAVYGDEGNLACTDYNPNTESCNP